MLLRFALTLFLIFIPFQIKAMFTRHRAAILLAHQRRHFSMVFPPYVFKFTDRMPEWMNLLRRCPRQRLRQYQKALKETYRINIDEAHPSIRLSLLEQLGPESGLLEDWEMAVYMQQEKDTSAAKHIRALEGKIIRRVQKETGYRKLQASN